MEEMHQQKNEEPVKGWRIKSGPYPFIRSMLYVIECEKGHERLIRKTDYERGQIGRCRVCFLEDPEKGGILEDLTDYRKKNVLKKIGEIHGEWKIKGFSHFVSYKRKTISNKQCAKLLIYHYICECTCGTLKILNYKHLKYRKSSKICIHKSTVRKGKGDLLPQIIDHNNAINKRFEIDAMELKQLRNLYTDDQLKAMDILT